MSEFVENSIEQQFSKFQKKKNKSEIELKTELSEIINLNKMIDIIISIIYIELIKSEIINQKFAQ